MATIQDIATNNNYRGDVALGGGSQGQFKPDLSAFQRLADFTYYKEREDKEIERKQRDADVANVTEALSIDYSSIPDKWRQEVIDKLKDFQDFYQQNPDAVRVQSGKYGDYLKKKTELANLAKAGTARGVELKAELAKINEMAADAPNKQAMIASIKKQMEGGGIFTPLEGIGKSAVTVDMADTPLTSKIFVEGKNANKEIVVSGYNMFDAWGKIPAYLATLGDENAPPYLKKIQGMVKERNKMVDATNGPVDYENLPLTQQIKEYNEAILKSKTTTVGATGKTQAEIQGGVPPLIDPTKPMTEEEMAAVYAFAAHGKGASIAEDGTQTNAALTAENMRLDYKAAMANIANDRAKWESAAKGTGTPQQQYSSAAVFASKLMEKLSGLSKNGVISGDALGKLTATELSAMGLATTSNNQVTIEPLDVKNKVLRLNQDGTIEVFNSDGTRNTSAINLTSIATTKLAEEMVTTSGKEGFNFNTIAPLYGLGQQQAAPAAVSEYVEEKTASNGKRYGKNKKGQWIEL